MVGKGLIVKIYTVVLHMELAQNEDDPALWDWRELLDLAPDHAGIHPLVARGRVGAALADPAQLDGRHAGGSDLVCGLPARFQLDSSDPGPLLVLG